MLLLPAAVGLSLAAFLNPPCIFGAALYPPDDQLLIITSSRAVMGEHVNPRWFQAAMGLVTAGLVGLNGYLAVSFCLEELPDADWAMAIFGIVFAAYVSFLSYLIVGPKRCALGVAEHFGAEGGVWASCRLGGVWPSSLQSPRRGGTRGTDSELELER